MHLPSSHSQAGQLSFPRPILWGPYSTDWLSAKPWALPHGSVLLPEDRHPHKLTTTIQRPSSWNSLLNPQSMGSVELSPRREGHPLLGPWLCLWPASPSEQVTPSDTLSPKMSYTVSPLYPWFCFFGFLQPQIKNIQEKKFQKVPVSKILYQQQPLTFTWY